MLVGFFGGGIVSFMCVRGAAYGLFVAFVRGLLGRVFFCGLDSETYVKVSCSVQIPNDWCRVVYGVNSPMASLGVPISTPDS